MQQKQKEQKTKNSKVIRQALSMLLALIMVLSPVMGMDGLTVRAANDAQEISGMSEKLESGQASEGTEQQAEPEKGQEETREESGDNQQAGTTDGAAMFAAVTAAGDAGVEVTRLEWLTALTKAFEMTVEEDNYPDNYYSDISAGDANYYEVMLATEFGLVDVEAGDPLRPDDAATREFAAHTLNLCLGLQTEGSDYTFAESESVSYPEDIQVALDKGWFTLTDGKALPDNALTVQERDGMLEYAGKIRKSTQIDEGHVNQWELVEGVIDLTSGVTAQMTDENEYTLQNCSRELAEGDIYAVLIDGLPVVKKVVSLKEEGTGYIIQTEDVEPSEAFKSLDIQASVASDLTKAILCRPDMEIQYIVGGTAAKKWEDGTAYNSVAEAGSQKISAIAVTESYDIPKEILKKYDLGDGLTADITCTVSDPFTYYSASLWRQEAYVQVGGIVSFSCNVSMDVLDAIGVAPSIELVKIPLAGGIGYIKVTLDLTLKGKVNFTLVEYVSMGVQYTSDEGFRLIRDFYQEDFSNDTHAEASAGFTAKAGFNCAGILKGEAYAKAGLKATMDGEHYDDGEMPQQCDHVNAWLYASVGANATFNYVFDKKEWVGQKDIFTEQNSPLRTSFHWEDGKAVTRCTRENSGGSSGSSESTIVNSNTSEGRWKYYTPADSRYGYNGISSGIDSSGKEYTIFDYDLKDDGSALITKYNGNVSALTIPETLDGYMLTGIGNSVFRNNKRLKSVVIPDSVTSIGNSAFSGCTNLANVTLSNKLKTIGDYAFQECDSLTSIEIPKSLEVNVNDNFNRGNEGPFADCSNLKTVTFEEGITGIREGLFSGCDGLERIVIPDTVTLIGVQAFEDCVNLKEIEIADSITRINSYAFRGCVSLTGIVIPDSVTYMGTYIFAGCTSLATATLPNKRVNLREGTFQNCTSLTTITLPETVTAIRRDAFQNCTSLKDINFPAGLEIIEAYAFYDCDALTAVTIPGSVTSIGTYCFADCETLKELTLGTGLTEIPAYAFHLCPALELVVLPYRIVTVKDNAFTNCTGLTELTVPRGTTSIGSNAVSYPTKMTVYGISGTYAEKWAGQVGAKFVNRAIPATAVSLNEETLTVNKGKTAALVMKVTPADFTDEVDWKSSDEAVATVSSAGVVTAKGLGEATIRVTVGNLSASCKVTVVQPVTGISLNKTSLSLEALETYTLTASVSPSSANDKTVTWSSSDEAVASVEQSGIVTALKKGTADITATANDGSGVSRSCRVTVTGNVLFCDTVEKLESPHNYENNCKDVWVYTLSGSETLKVTFDERTNIEEDFDYLYLYDGKGELVEKYTGTALAGQTVTIPGDTVRIKLESDKSGNTWGFKVTGVSGDGGSGDGDVSSGDVSGGDISGGDAEAYYVITVKYADYVTGDRVLNVKKGERLTQELLPNPARAGYLFDGWVDEQNHKIILPIAPDRDMTLTATWRKSSSTGDGDDSDIPKNGLYVKLLNGSVYTYTGSAIKPAVRVTHNGVRLTEGVDYTVKYSSNVKASVGVKKQNSLPKVTVTGRGNYTGNASVNFTIQPKSLTDSDSGVNRTPKLWCPTKLSVVLNTKASPVLYYGSKKLGSKDYDLSSGAGSVTKPGKITADCTLYVIGKGNFTGTAQIAVRAVEKNALKKLSVTQAKGFAANYDGGEHKPVFGRLDGGADVEVTAKGETVPLQEGQDYYVVYPADMTNAGTVKYTVIGIGEYGGSVTKSYKIRPVKASEGEMRVDFANQSEGYLYRPTGATVQGLTVTYHAGQADERRLVAGRDYKVSYSNNRKAGTGRLNITFLGNYKGSRKKTESFRILQAYLDESGHTAAVTVPDKIYKKAGVYKSTPIVTIDGVALKRSDYTASYEYQDAAGKWQPMDGKHKLDLDKMGVDSVLARVVITGKGGTGNYSSDAGHRLTKEYRVSRLKDGELDLSKAIVNLYDKDGRRVTKLAYTGGEVVPYKVEVTYKVDGVTVTLAPDQYELSYANNVNKGRATLVITGTGKQQGGRAFLGSKSVGYSIMSMDVKSNAIFDMK